MPDRNQQASAILKSIKQSEGGKLKIFLGAAPGVGKTYAMLCAARERLQQGDDVLVGLAETHGRAETEKLLDGFEVLPRKQIGYRGHTLTEFDLDEALERKPQVILVDELAHTNVPGSRHKRRYQDIAELLTAGIDVYTTLNIQHLVSVNDLVLQITGVRVHETVPDQFIDDANEIVFVDLPPSTLIERLHEGKVYLPEYARSALDSFFSSSNLTALRELAMREVMERVDARLKTEQDARAAGLEYAIQEKLLVLISSNSDHEYLIRIGRQIADRRRLPWTVVWVDTGRIRNQKASARLQSAFALAKELGAETETLRGPNTYQAIVPFIQEHRINTVLVGSGSRHRWQPWRKRLYQHLIESGLPLEVSVFRSPNKPVELNLAEPRAPLVGSKRGHLFALAAVAVATLSAVLMEIWIKNYSLVLLYVFAVVITGLRYGSRPAIFAAVLSFLNFNFFLTDPRYTFAVVHPDELAALIFLFLIALVCGPVASRIRRQFILLHESNRYSEAMRLLGQELSVADDAPAVWEALAKELKKALQRECCVVVAEGDCKQEEEPFARYPGHTFSFSAVDKAAIEWTLRYAQPSGRFTDTLSAAAWTAFPVSKDDQCIACVLVRFDVDRGESQTYNRDLIADMSRQAADTWRRIDLTRDLESARVKTEVEQLRSALLSSVSHDLKSPLAAMMGAAESLKLLDKQLAPTDREELADTILQESGRLDRYIQNLLDMTRLGHGSLKIERDWVSSADIIGSAMTRLKRYFPGVKTEYSALSPPPLLFAHAALIEQALFNILENAAKFSPPDETIAISVEKQGNKCVIEIEDRGPGIPESLREQIFDMFYVVSDGDQKKQNTGMGLAICRGMIGAHGGSVDARTGSQGKGTRFVVELPIDYPDSQE
ncbi:sensor histidine kinase KdpD [Microbulbifer sp.]|uniref:sensor histidine kinase n=1 Tax=Microbulbifer sp. TaxID=1908541 RepID=UPI0025912155|nr:sensor histidine kinase KdpD [Microbulbifer sp.]